MVNEWLMVVHGRLVEYQWSPVDGWLAITWRMDSYSSAEITKCLGHCLLSRSACHFWRAETCGNMWKHQPPTLRQSKFATQIGGEGYGCSDRDRPVVKNVQIAGGTCWPHPTSALGSLEDDFGHLFEEHGRCPGTSRPGRDDWFGNLVGFTEMKNEIYTP